MEPTPDQKESALRLLIADDDPPTRILLRAAISQWGYNTVEANNGEEAWNVLQLPDPPKLLIIDWLMPKLDGVELCKRIRTELPNSNMFYIVLLTQMTGTENIIKGLEAGANEFLSKPFNMAELRSRLSVGRKIIQYTLAFQEFALQLKNITKHAHSSSSKLTMACANLQDSSNFTKIKEVATELDKLVSDCKNLTIIADKKI